VWYSNDNVANRMTMPLNHDNFVKTKKLVNWLYIQIYAFSCVYHCKFISLNWMIPFLIAHAKQKHE
jgi:hypothetical protein